MDYTIEFVKHPRISLLALKWQENLNSSRGEKKLSIYFRVGRKILTQVDIFWRQISAIYVLHLDLIPREGFLSLNNLPAVSCRHVLRLFMSTGLILRFSMSIFALFPVYMSTGLCNYGVVFFYVVIFNPDVYFMTCKKINVG